MGNRRLVSGSSQRGRSAHDLTPLVPAVGGLGGEWRENRGQVDVGATHVSRVRESGWPFRFQRGSVGRMGVKRPEMGPTRRLFRRLATWVITAQLLFQDTVKSKVASHEPQERNRRKFQLHINLIRKRSSPDFCRNLKT